MTLGRMRTAAAALVLFLLGPLLAFLGIVPPIIGFWIFAAGGLLAIIATIFGLIATLRSGFAIGGGNLVLGAILSAVFLANALPGRGFPRINDITTDTANPPQFVHLAQHPQHAGRDLAYPGETFATQQQSGYADLRPLKLQLPPEQAFTKAEHAARQVSDWEIVHVDPAARRIEGTATSKLFRFKDDFVIEVRPDGNGSSVHMRSKSRVGRGDIGANAARIRMFFDQLD